MNDGVLQGSYNPAGFSTEQVKLYAKHTGARPSSPPMPSPPRGADGLVAFRATCRGEMPDGFASIVKLEDGSVHLEATLSKDRELYFDRREF